MPRVGLLLYRIYASVAVLPIIGYLVRLPVKTIRDIVRPDITTRIDNLSTQIDQKLSALAAPSPAPAAGTSAAIGGLWDAVSGLQVQIQGLWHRLEFVRAETMFEMRAAMAVKARSDIGHQLDTSRRIKDQQKVDAALASGNLRLHIGCGHLPLDGYANVDGRDLPGVDVVADAADIPFPIGSVTEVYSSHLLEHFPLEHLRRVVLPHWFALLKPGGALRSVVPDAEGMISDYVSKAMSFDDLREVTYGLQEYNGDFHFNMFSRDMLRALVEEVGFVDASYSFLNRKNGKCRDMELIALKP
jgi:predicted SAM-dependent methyltransferase